MKITRRATFSSGHRYWRTDLSPEDNYRLFGPWASPHYHGHNYVLDVTYKGSVSVENDMVANLTHIRDILHSKIVEPLHQKSLNEEVPFFQTHPPTLENIARYILQLLLPPPEGLSIGRIRLAETDTLYVELSPQGERPMFTLTRVYDFCASHRLYLPHLSDEENLNLFGKCSNPHGHGHNYFLEVTVTGEPDPETGMIARIEDIDSVVTREILHRYDHKNLNVEVPELQDINPTTERITEAIFHRLKKALPVKLLRVRLQETPRNWCEYSEEDETP
jgi:6-pyruvoyltetrahydropterin/6-carboxytetrahydropterin synthase